MNKILFQMSGFRFTSTSIILILLFSTSLFSQEIKLEGTVVIPAIDLENEAGDLLIRTNDGKVKQRSLSSLPAADCNKPWVQVGTLDELLGVILPAYPTEAYEYAYRYNSLLIQRAMITTWNRGTRIYNMDMHFVAADNPNIGMKYGGSMFYTGTGATDYDSCGVNWRNKHWYLDSSKNEVVPFASNGCVSIPIYVRKL